MTTLKRLPQSLRDRFIGGTFHKREHGSDPRIKEAFVAMARGAQVCADVLRRRPSQWIALDDDTEHWPDWARHNLVACDGTTGLSCARVRAELQEKLQWCVRELSKEASRRKDLFGSASGADDAGHQRIPSLLRTKEAQPFLMDTIENLIRQGHLVAQPKFEVLMGWTSSRSVSRALAGRRIFAMESEGKQYFPAFFSDAKCNRRHLGAVTKLLGDLPPGAKLQFFGSRKASLRRETPLEALAAGRLEAVMRLAAAYAEL